MPNRIKRIIGQTLRRFGLLPDFQYPDGITDSIRNTWQSIQDRRLTYLSNPRLASLVSICQRVDRHNVEGVILEAGCALGGSAILFCSAKQPERALEVYDVFGMIPPPSDKDGPDVHKRYETISQGKATGIDGKPYYGYEENLRDKVEQSFIDLGFPLKETNVTLVEGLVQDTIPKTGPVALAHIDLDWYDPVKTCLERIVPRLSPGGIIILDDYKDWSGCQQATDDFFEHICKDDFKFDDTAGHLTIERLR